MTLKKLIPVLSVLLLASSVLAEPQVLVLKDGRRIEGEISRTDEGAYEVTTEYATLRFPAENVETVAEATASQDGYRTKLSEIDPNSPADHYRVARWAYGQERFDVALTEAEKALELDPDYRQAKLLRRLIQSSNARNQQQPADTQPGAARDADARYWVPMEDVYRIRLAELEVEETRSGRPHLTERLPIRMQNNVVDRFLEQIGGQGPFDSSDFRRRFRTARPRTQTAYMLRWLPKESPLRDDIHVIRDPQFMLRFQRRVWPVVKDVVRAAYQEKGLSRAKLATVLGTQRPERRAYTTFVLMDGYEIGGERLINRDSPRDSLLLQWGLPDRESRIRRPRSMPTAYRSTGDPRYRRVLRWIESLQVPRPNYRLEYRPPHGIELDLGGRPPLPADLQPEPTTEPTDGEDDEDGEDAEPQGSDEDAGPVFPD